MQIISLMNQIFRAQKNCKLWLKPYEILATGPGCGIIEFINDALSMDYIKRKLYNQGKLELADYFRMTFGTEKSKKYQRAVKNFCDSLAAYSLVCYILQIKDRHNANILLDKEGHIIHIDFGYLLTNMPGKGFRLEKAPFKLTGDFVNVMHGTNGEYFKRFRRNMTEGFYHLNQNAEKIILLV